MMAIAPLIRVESLAIPIPAADIDTDIIFPARFLLLTNRDGLGSYAFHDWRFDDDGQPRKDFAWNQPSLQDASIIVAGANFGCGSSREQAVWALHGAGIRAIVAPSFGEIFRGNCLRNGLLPIELSGEAHELALQAAESGIVLSIDLEQQWLSARGRELARFDIPQERKIALMNGWDETDQIRQSYGAQIAAFEQHQSQLQPWLHESMTP